MEQHMAGKRRPRNFDTVAPRAPRPDPADDMLSGIRYADEPEPEPAPEPVVEAKRFARPTPERAPVAVPEAQTEQRIADAKRAFERMNNESARLGHVEELRKPHVMPKLPPLDEETTLRLRPKIYKIMRHPDRPGAYQIPAGVMRTRTPGVSIVELVPGQVITDRDYDIDRLRAECGVIVEDYKQTASA